MTDGADGLYEDCVGPSAHWKAQGTPVRTWGLLVKGRLRLAVLPANQAAGASIASQRALLCAAAEHKFAGSLRGTAQRTDCLINSDKY